MFGHWHCRAGSKGTAGRPRTGLGERQQARARRGLKRVAAGQSPAGGERNGPLQRATGGHLRGDGPGALIFDLGVTSLEGYFATCGVFPECHRLGRRDMVFVPFPVEALAFSGSPGDSRAPPEPPPGARVGTDEQNERSLLACASCEESDASNHRFPLKGRTSSRVGVTGK